MRLEQAGQRWAEQLQAWAIPAGILEAAPESPWGFPTSLFERNAQAALEDPEATPSRRRALEALGAGGSVLDVGAGAGAASLPLAPPAHLLTGVDESAPMLAAFEAGAAARGVAHRTVVGRWPDVAKDTARADVVVCHHVLYNVADVVPFVRALQDHAGRRVVIEITELHPQSDLNPLWAAIHHVDRPSGPMADDAFEVLAALGLNPQGEHFSRPVLWSSLHRDERIAFARRRLCVGPDRDEEIGRLLDGQDTQTRGLVTFWWDA